jgi:mono/diheme cytochrome c family protein
MLFYTARRAGLSEGVACSGCHPEGRDDGHVWHEVDTASVPKPNLASDRIFVGGFGTIEIGGAPRQTPMLAGRLASPGPYGWLGEDVDLVARITHGAALHRWQPWYGRSYEVRDRKAAIERLARFIRVGLVPPPRVGTPPTPEQARGKALFENKEVGCSSCHLGDGEPAMVTKLPKLPAREGFDDEDMPLKVPSLRFVGGTPPYLHDGSEPTLRQLLDDNHDRMGHTAQLSADDRAALAAYLETL